MKILVIGESCQDIFVYGSVNRLTPEAPAPIFCPSHKTFNDGMAKNVLRNIEAIGIDCKIITNDEQIIKTRFVDEKSNYILLRLDENDSVRPIKSNIINDLKNNLYNGINYDAIIISDYCKGFISESDIETISQNNFNIFLDTKKILGKWCEKTDYIKINNTEYEKTKHTLHNLNIEEKLIITRSEKGCEYKNNIYPVRKVNIKDLSGAGDTFIAALTCEWLKTKDIVKAIDFAQDCAAKVVEKKGVCTI